MKGTLGPMAADTIYTLETYIFMLHLLGDVPGRTSDVHTLKVEI